MAKFIRRLSYFFFFCILFYTFSLIIWGNIIPEKLRNLGNFLYPIGDYGHLYTRIQEASETQNIDILVLGSSHAYRGLDPRFFKSKGYEIFNFGSSSQSPIQMKYLVSRYINKLNPKLVLIEVYPNTFQSDGVESSLDFIANDKLSFNIIKMVVHSHNLKVFNALLYKLYRSTFCLDKQFIEPIKSGEDTYIEGGFVESELKYYNSRRFMNMEWELLENQKAEFQSTLLMLKKKNIAVILFQAPITKGLYDAYLNTEEIDKYFRSFDYNYTNFNSIAELKEDTLFYDQHHLNKYGVKLFNQVFFDTYKHELQKYYKQPAE